MSYNWQPPRDPPDPEKPRFRLGPAAWIAIALAYSLIGNLALILYCFAHSHSR